MRPSEADNNDPLGIRCSERWVFGGLLEEKEGVATSRTWPGDFRVNMLLNLGSGELLLTRARCKSGLGDMVGGKRWRKADYRGLNVITYKMVG